MPSMTAKPVENVSVSIRHPFFLTARVDPWLDHTPVRPGADVQKRTLRAPKAGYSGGMTFTVWMVLILAVAATAVVVFASWRRGIEMTELGNVSQNWLSEQRAHDRHYSER